VVEPDFADKRGSFFGTVTLSNKKDFGLLLIQEGLAQVSIIGNKAPYNIDELERAEEQARLDGLGIWDKKVKVMGGGAQAQGKQVRLNERLAVEMTDITDASRFFLRFLADNQYAKIEALMNKFDSVNALDLERPIKKGTICAARFSADGNWYRARVLRGVGKNSYEVEFIDFGN
jgi:staphylococcal nuclease domain-containing protein 1